MAIKKCWECGARISSTAKACPQCGAKPNGGSFLNLAARVVVGVLLLMWWFGDHDGGNEPEQVQRPVIHKPRAPIAVTAEELASAYEENEVRANQRFKGKPLKVTGTVANVSENVLLSGTYVVLECTGFRDVQCFFDKSHSGAVSRLSSGQQVTIIGEGSGAFGNVHVTGCRLQ